VPDPAITTTILTRFCATTFRADVETTGGLLALLSPLEFRLLALHFVIGDVVERKHL
jgi:hypothetical protein